MQTHCRARTGSLPSSHRWRCSAHPTGRACNSPLCGPPASCLPTASTHNPSKIRSRDSRCCDSVVQPKGGLAACAHKQQAQGMTHSVQWPAVYCAALHSAHAAHGLCHTVRATPPLVARRCTGRSLWSVPHNASHPSTHPACTAQACLQGAATHGGALPLPPSPNVAACQARCSTHGPRVQRARASPPTSSSEMTIAAWGVAGRTLAKMASSRPSSRTY